MSDRKSLTDPNETPEDVATLYSWANLHGAKYRDFSASRAKTREMARLRVQETIEAERRRAREREEAEAKKAAHQRAIEAEHEAELQARQQAEREAAERAAQLQPAAQQRAWASAQAPTYPAPAFPQAPLDYASPAPAQYFAPAQPQPYTPLPAARETPQVLARPNAELRENVARPAWLAANHTEVSAAPALYAPEDTLQGSRDRLASRWFALKGVFAADVPVPVEPAPAPSASRVPVLAVFSLAGGVGKTSLLATLGRALSARGERVLLVDTAAYGLLPFFFGAREQRPGVLRTFTAPGNSGDAPIQLLTVDCGDLGSESSPQEALSQEIARNGRGLSRILIDVATASGSITRRILRTNPTVLVPMIPDMSSVVSVTAIDTFFQRNAGSGQAAKPFYVLNRFDPSLPLHLDVREVLRDRLGDRLLPFSLCRAPAVSEALAEGMTVVDYAPNSTVAEDYGALAGWVKSLAAPASTGFRGVRWSER